MAFHGPVLYLYLGSRCNSRCQFCVVDGRQDAEMSLTEVVNKLTAAKRYGMQDVVFSGGDPTIRSDILVLVEKAKDLGYLSIQIQTNGRRLADKQFAKDITIAGATEFSISLHGHVPAIQDRITGVLGSFQETIGGMINLYELLGNQAIVVTNSVITYANLKYLSNLVELLTALKVCTIQLAYIHAQGRADSQFDKITPYKLEAMPYIHSALETAISFGYDAGKMMVEAYPYCFLRGYEAFSSDMYIPHLYVRAEDDSIEAFPVTQARAKGPCCIECTFDGICYGPWREYPERRGWDEFVPIKDCCPGDMNLEKIYG